jgi:two-component system, sensor histidine kinase RetS
MTLLSVSVSTVAKVTLKSGETHSVLEYAWLLTDPGMLSIEDAGAKPRQNRYRASHSEYLRTGFSQQSYWLRFEIDNQLSENAVVLSLKGLNAVKWSFYQQTSLNENPQYIVIEHKDNYALFTPHPGITQYFLHIQPELASSIQLNLMGQAEFMDQSMSDALKKGIFSGILLALLLSLVFVYKVLKHYQLVLVAGYLSVFIVFQLVLVSGLLSVYLLPYSISFATLAALLLSLISRELFAKSITRRWNVFSSIIFLLYIVIFILSFFNDVFSASLLMMTSLGVSVLLLTNYRDNSNGQRQMIFAWLVFLVLLIIELPMILGFSLWPEIECWLIMVFTVVHVVALLYSFRFWHDQIKKHPEHVENTDTMNSAVLRKLNHDMRGPINGVLGMSELLNDTSLSAHQFDYLGTIISSGYQLLNIADEMRGFAHLKDSNAYQQQEEFLISDMIDGVLKPFRHLASQKNLELINEWSPITEMKVKGSKVVIEQILRSLIDNAISYADSGEVALQVKKMPNNAYRFRISDSGFGLSEKQQRRLFSIEDEHHSQTHYGLPLVQKLAEKINTKIEFSSQRDYGSSLWFNVNLVEIKTDIVNQARVDPLLLSRLKGLKVLIVDDSQSCRNVLQYQLSALDIQSQAASSGQQALAALQSYRSFGDSFNLVLMDYQMPTMDGLEVARRIRADETLKSLYIIMLSGRDLTVFQGEMSGLDIYQILQKPVNSTDLKASLIEALKHMMD